MSILSIILLCVAIILYLLAGIIIASFHTILNDFVGVPTSCVRFGLSILFWPVIAIWELIAP
jgi:hypothetical protein